MREGDPLSAVIVLLITTAVFAFQYFAPRYGPSWLGAVMPLLACALSIFLLIKTGIHGFKDILLPVLLVFALLATWGGALEKRKGSPKESSDSHL